ncbi:uncharacterized protein LOC115217066 [Octopus sinensis]|uniref:Uncharacterized protein LOC115217066 n=1 Tax=Octopus sinensis TaxID=2607531 RepID=A0A6P7SXD0_9MOLL|nr:uncharacterized protein LOC115217066 [Octopus sinensis]
MSVKPPSPQQVVIYNEIPPPKEPVASGTLPKASDVVESLRSAFSSLKTKYISKDGRSVNYQKLKTSAELKNLEKEVQKLVHINLEDLSIDDQKALFINLFNILTIHAIALQPSLPQSIRNISHFWDRTAYKIGSETYTLNDIEHGILRGNKPPPTHIELPFGPKDARLKFVMKPDPRIHFALVWGCKTSPQINIYQGKNLESSLEEAMKTLCEQEVCMFTEINEIWLPSLFKWYQKDFGKSDTDAVRSVMPYLSKEKKNRAELLLLALDRIGNVNLKLTPYEWQLNNSGTV